MISIAAGSALVAALGAGLLSYSAFHATPAAKSAVRGPGYSLNPGPHPIAAPQLPQWSIGETLTWTGSLSDEPIKRQAGPYVIEISRDAEGDMAAPVIRMSSGNQIVTMRGDMSPITSSHSMTLISNRANAVPVLMLESFTGGAHCCFHVQLAGFSKGQLKIVNLGSWDSQIAPPADLTGDGVVDFKTQDDRFLYAFAPYAYSLAPPQFLNVVNGAIKDVSRDSHFRSSFADVMNSASASCQPGTGYTANGACPAFVAAAARLGKLDAAWSQMVAAYDPTVDWSLPTGCLVSDRNGCPQGQEIVYKSYPDALRAFLVRTGYISPFWIPPEQRAQPEQPPVPEKPTA